MKPKATIRRFDVFAEYSKLEALRDGRPLAEAKGHGIWLAKVVASRRRAPTVSPSREPVGAGHGGSRLPEPEERFKTLGGDLQSDAQFDREVVQRMGERFYDEVFAPTIRRHFERGERYEAIRDAVRREWIP